MTELADSSKKTYKAIFKTLTDKIINEDIDYIISHSEEVISKIREYKEDGKGYSNNYLKLIISAILSTINHKYKVSKVDQKLLPENLQVHYKKYDEYYNYYDAILDETKHEMSDKQLKGYIPLEEIIKKRDELEKKDAGGKEHLLLSLYTYIDPIRQDYNDVEILMNGEEPTEDRKKKNYIVFSKKGAKLYLNKYKTSKKLNETIIDIPEKLQEIILLSLKKYPRKYLFSTNKNTHYEKQSYITTVNRILLQLFNKPGFTISLLRVINISNANIKDMNAEDRIKKAKNMCHSVQTQNKYNKKLPKNELEKEKNVSSSDTEIISEDETLIKDDKPVKLVKNINEYLTKLEQFKNLAMELNIDISNLYIKI